MKGSGGNTFGDPPLQNRLEATRQTPNRGSRMYYQRLDVRRAILDFANTGGSRGVRECAFYNQKTKSLQRYLDANQRTPICFEEPTDIDRVLAAGASAFYASYWRYYLDDFNNPIGIDLVWTIRAESSGLKFAKEATSWVLQALEAAGVSEPWVKYSGGLGFDLVIPLETVPFEAWAGDVGVLQEMQEGLTSYIVSYLVDHQADVLVDGVVSPVKLKRGKETCLLSELRVKRGLLLAPMSLNPETGLVSVTINPKRLDGFTVWHASPEDARGVVWAPPSRESYELLRQIRPWLPEAMAAETSVF
ncbi:MAG: hypothetical protein APZ16_01830 [Candidatus Hadarchaeum yellowstonense]|jgi:hypothetical protein|uniref:Uncharacterized protein n=1 Tax=Hadarchaeum yellowstonense TaxID=1776334 RepID=A0A147K196_HADYE|nr:MAG: hypothetical protein APZ16_01830 [Candidatus Hadarchaeum yellowstonense]